MWTIVFVSIGIGLDLSLLAAQPVLIVALLVGLMLLNGCIVFGLARLFGLATTLLERLSRQFLDS